MAVEQKTDEFLRPNYALERLLWEYKEYGYLVVAYDFDNTISPMGDNSATYNQVIQLIKDLKANIKCKMVCWTANPNLDYVEKYLIANNIPYNGINCEGIDLSYQSRKPAFSALLDDRAGLIEVYNYLSEFLRVIIAERKGSLGYYRLKADHSVQIEDAAFWRLPWNEQRDWEQVTVIKKFDVNEED